MLKKERFYFCLFNSIIGLSLGTLIYISFGENTYINKVIPISLSFRSLFTDILLFYVADALWAYALTFALSLFISETLSGILTAIYGILWEILQSFHPSLGTFDTADIIMYLSASTFAVLIINLYKKYKRRKK